MAENVTCPVCFDAEVLDVLLRDRLPVMQNVVFADRELATKSPCGSLQLSICRTCGFAFNRAFDPSLMRYDESYDNSVPSPLFDDYYRELARMLASKFRLDTGAMYDVGCGKGRFLEILCELNPGVSGIGIDPSCVPRETGNLRLIRDVFSRQQFVDQPSLVVCRHVLEHIARPRDFAAALVGTIAAFPQVRAFLEVPDLNWILENGAFWDFCYEHCNYFTPESLANTLTLSGFEVSERGFCFGQQYQWISCSISSSLPSAQSVTANDLVERALAYARAERHRMEEARASIEAARRAGPCVLWGMATKGVVFANLIDPKRELIAGGIDVNRRKQGKYIPGTGHGIYPPSWLTELEGTPTVFVMNRNYAEEIDQMIAALGVHADLRVL